jgi:hypothetical protein
VDLKDIDLNLMVVFNQLLMERRVGRVPRTHERKHLSLRRLLQHRRCHHRSQREQNLKLFTYERARSPAEAATAAARMQGAKFIAGGANLLDLMKLEIETPTHLIDVNGLALDKIESTPDWAAHRCTGAQHRPRRRHDVVRGQAYG